MLRKNVHTVKKNVAEKKEQKGLPIKQRFRFGIAGNVEKRTGRKWDEVKNQMKESTKFAIVMISMGFIVILLMATEFGFIFAKTYDTSITVIGKHVTENDHFYIASCDHEYSIDPFIGNDFYLYSLFDEGGTYQIQVSETFSGKRYIEKVYDETNKLCS